MNTVRQFCHLFSEYWRMWPEGIHCVREDYRRQRKTELLATTYIFAPVMWVLVPFACAIQEMREQRRG